MKTRIRNTLTPTGIPKKGKININKSWEGFTWKDYDIFFVGIILFSSIFLILYANSGLDSIVSPLLVIAGLIGVYFTIKSLWNSSWKNVYAYQKSKIIFRASSLSDSNYIPVNISSQNLQNHMKFYPQEKLKAEFQQYLFWKDIIVSVYSGYFIFLCSYILLYIFIGWESRFWEIFFGAFGLGFLYFLFSMRKYLNFLVHKKDISLLTLEFRPKLYCYLKNKNIFFH